MNSTLYAKDTPPYGASAGARGKAFRRAAPAAAIFLALCAVPAAAHLLGQPFWLGLVARIMILGLAAVGLNLVLGYGGMVSLGHAMYLGIGAYSVGILSAHGVDSGLAHLAVALAAGAAVALIVGLVCLKTSGMAFIMITLAFAQMFYFLAISLKQYGGDDGLTIASHSRVPGLSLDDPYQFYLLVLAVLAIICALCKRLTDSRFGLVLRGSRQNPRRMRALGFPLLRYRLAAYVLSAMIVVMAGVLLANLARFASPSYMSWTLSGDLVLMCVLGGMATLLGPIVGAAAFVLLEEFLSGMPLDLPAGAADLIRTHWLGVFGVFVVAVVLFARRGLYGALAGREDTDG
ncbi:MAG: branched-chain amino acid ABC transporter permease [Pigmentiphaga sp.]|uniref:branched-chain amino acid ABC transporter permease n=1 Tax=Pigmentiphaga sp. TaxID=1977564 RepID=UPI003B55F77E